MTLQLSDLLNYMVIIMSTFIVEVQTIHYEYFNVEVEADNEDQAMFLLDEDIDIVCEAFKKGPDRTDIRDGWEFNSVTKKLNN
jgi:hypothetical protein